MFEGVKVFSATKFRERAQLGDDITKWLSESNVEVVTQSSDDQFHCLSITLFYRGVA